MFSTASSFKQNPHVSDLVYSQTKGLQFHTQTKHKCVFGADVVLPEMANPLNPTARTRKEMATPRVWENPTTNSRVASIPNPVKIQDMRMWVNSSFSNVRQGSVRNESGVTKKNNTYSPTGLIYNWNIVLKVHCHVSNGLKRTFKCFSEQFLNSFSVQQR